MGRKAVEISGADVQQTIQLLNEALAEEWLAYYQYWIGAPLMVGPMRSEIEPELLLHATQELGHAQLVLNRILQLGGTPLLNPNQWKDYAKCPYEEPIDPYVETVLEQNLNGERCAIQRYQSLAAYAESKDYATYQMALTILADELEHEHDIEDFLSDIERLKEDIRNIRL
jgi:bacterioferritin